MKKLKGIKFKNTDGGYGYGPYKMPLPSDTSGYGYTQEPRGPRSQADCPKGMVYKPVQTLVACGGLGQSECPPGSCIEPRSQADCPDGTTFSPSYIGGDPNSKMPSAVRVRAKCIESIAPTEPKTEPKTMGIGTNWLLTAILVGVGIYLITRKSE